MIAVKSACADDYEQPVKSGSAEQRFVGDFMFGRTLVGQPAGARADRIWRRDCLPGLPPTSTKDPWPDVARAPLWWQLPGDPWEPPPAGPPLPPPAPQRPRPRPVLGCHRNDVTPSPAPPTRCPLFWQWGGYRWPKYWDWDTMMELRKPIPRAGVYSGIRVAYDKRTLLQLRNCAVAQEPPEDLSTFPKEIQKNGSVNSEDSAKDSQQPNPQPTQQ